MMKHYEIQSTVWHKKPIVFDWDESTGEVKGQDAEKIKDMATWGSVYAHPCPWSWTLSADPLKSKTDMAVIIGWEHRLPPDLIDFYPKPEDDGFPDVTYVDEDGITVIGRDEVCY